MKKKKIVLHICILLLAAVCLAAGIYVAYWEDKSSRYGWDETYNATYTIDVSTVLEYCQMQSEFREKFGDENKVLIEDDELGNVTVKDIIDIAYDYYFGYLNYNGEEYYADYEDYEEGKGNEDNTLYGIDRAHMEKYKADYKNDKIEDNYRRYKYYKAKCDYVDEYSDLAMRLLEGTEEARLQTEGIGYEDGFNYVNKTKFEPAYLIDETCPPVYSGMKYYVEYTSNGIQYLVSNVGEETVFKNADMSDVTYFKDGELVQDKPLCGNKAYTNNEIVNGFLGQVDSVYVAIDLSEKDSHYSTVTNYIINEPSEEEQQAIKYRELLCIVVIIVAMVIALILFIMLMLMAGHKQKGDGPKLCKFDKCWWDVGIVIAIVIGVLLFGAFIDLFYDAGETVLFVISVAIAALPAVECVILFSESLMRRLKAKSFLKTTLIGKIWNVIKKIAGKVKVCCQKLYGNLDLTWKVVVLGVLLSMLQIMVVFVTYEYWEELIVLMLLVAMAVIWAICYLVWRYFSENKILQEGARKISEGDIDFKIENEMKFRVNKTLKDSINGIGDGLSAAVEDSIKNERMKTELITNVSHDLKTPLTSIINYVDLLKTDGVDSEKAEQYLDVLDKKSQRLKQLTEDLVEASKLSSGVAKLEKEKLDIVQLVNQSLGEYDEKFASKKLQIIKSVQEEPIYVMADGRKTWRLFENLYQNVYKYAMSGTRVYVDIKTESGKVVISVKNISESPLNFSADELMERFVRGDVSRTTEGSGLGLSIARSIVERHDGEMKIVLDGDLFKVEVVMNLMF